MKTRLEVKKLRSLVEGFLVQNGRPEWAGSQKDIIQEDRADQTRHDDMLVSCEPHL